MAELQKYKINNCLFPVQHVSTFYNVIFRETCSENIHMKYTG
jgi:hypothetical protein